MTAKSAPSTHLPVVLSAASLLRFARSWTRMNLQGCMFIAEDVSLAASRILLFTSPGTRFDANSLTSSFVAMASKASKTK